MKPIIRQDDGRARIAGVNIEIVEAGSGDPIVFLHPGIGQVLAEPFLGELAKQGHVIAPVLPGFGHSDLPADFSKIDDLAQFVLALLKELDLTDVTFLGASFGGWVAAEAAIRSTARIGRLVLLGPLGIKSGAPDEREIADIWGLPKATLRELQFSDPEKGAIPYHAMDESAVEGAVRSSEAEALFGWNPYMRNPVLARWLGAIDVPTIVGRGADDRFLNPANSAAFAAAIPGAELREIADAGHFPHIEQPEATAALVKDLSATAATAVPASA